MKKSILILLTVLLVALIAVGLAAEAKSGEEVTVTLTLNNTNAAYVKVVADYDESVFDLVKYSSDVGQAGTSIVVYDTKVLSSGPIGTVTLKVKDGAKAGTYTVSGTLAECWDLEDEIGQATVSGGTVTVAGSATPEPTAAPTAEPTPAPTAEPTAAPTAEPTAAPTAEPTAAPTAEPTAAPTAEPTAAPTAEPTAAPTAEPTTAPTAEPTAAPTTEPENDKAAYTVTDINYTKPLATGKVEHVNDTPELKDVYARVTFFCASGDCMSLISKVNADGTFKAGGTGNFVHISVIVLDVDDAYGAGAAIEHAYGNGSLKLK